MNKFLVIAICYLLLSSRSLRAQSQFIEGYVLYKVSIIRPSDSAVYEGTYKIIAKGRQLRKELKIGNNYDDVMIYNYNNNTVYSLHTASDKRFAVQLDLAELNKKLEKYSNYKIQLGEKTGKIAGYDASKAKVQYEHDTVEVSFANDVLLDNNKFFDRFPGFKNLLLSFDYLSGDGTRMHFEADEIHETPVENANFRVPQDLKIISYKEYKMLK